MRFSSSPLSRWARCAGLALLCAAATAPAAAAEAAGIVKTATGRVTLQRGDQTLPATPGTVVLIGDRIATAAASSVGITLVDDSRIAAGASSQLVVTQAAFNSTTHEGNIVLSLVRGALLYVSGLVAKQQPQNVRVETPTAVMGVRGTEFIVDTEARLERS